MKLYISEYSGTFTIHPSRRYAEIKKVKNDGWQAICLLSKLRSIQQQGQKTSAITSISETPRSDFSTYIQIIRSFARQPRETPATMHHCQPKRWKNSNTNKVMTRRNLYYQQRQMHWRQELTEHDHEKSSMVQSPTASSTFLCWCLFSHNVSARLRKSTPWSDEKKAWIIFSAGI